MRVQTISIIVALLAVQCGGKVLTEDTFGGDNTTDKGDTNEDAGIPNTPHGGMGGIADAGSSKGSGTTDASVTGKDGGGTGPSAAGIACGAMTCNAGTEECCISLGGGGGGQGAQTCAPQGKCQGAALSCTGSSNCTNGQVCCASLSPVGGGAKCENACGGGGGGGGGGGAIQLCNGDKDCAKGDRCQKTPFGVSVCQPGRGGGGMGGMGGGMGGNGN